MSEEFADTNISSFQITAESVWQGLKFSGTTLLAPTAGYAYSGWSGSQVGPTTVYVTGTLRVTYTSVSSVYGNSYAVGNSKNGVVLCVPYGDCSAVYVGKQKESYAAVGDPTTRNYTFVVNLGYVIVTPVVPGVSFSAGPLVQTHADTQATLLATPYVTVAVADAGNISNVLTTTTAQGLYYRGGAVDPGSAIFVQGIMSPTNQMPVTSVNFSTTTGVNGGYAGAGVSDVASYAPSVSTKYSAFIGFA
jgi:hypothetical protein